MYHLVFERVLVTVQSIQYTKQYNYIQAYLTNKEQNKTKDKALRKLAAHTPSSQAVYMCKSNEYTHVGLIGRSRAQAITKMNIQ